MSLRGGHGSMIRPLRATTKQGRKVVAPPARRNGRCPLPPGHDAAARQWHRLCAAVADAFLSVACPSRALRPRVAPRRVRAAPSPGHRHPLSAPQGGCRHDRRREAGLHCSWYCPCLWHPLCGAVGSCFWRRRARPAGGAGHPYGTQDPAGATQGPRLNGVVRLALAVIVWLSLLFPMRSVSLLVPMRSVLLSCGRPACLRTGDRQRMRVALPRGCKRTLGCADACGIVSLFALVLLVWALPCSGLVPQSASDA